jgi:hypothetical protein
MDQDIAKTLELSGMKSTLTVIESFLEIKRSPNQINLNEILAPCYHSVIEKAGIQDLTR